MRFDEASVANGVEGSLALLARLGMQGDVPEEALPSQVFRGSTWVRADAGGIFLAHAQLGDWVEAEQVLGAVTNPFTHERVEVRALRSGRIIGRAVERAAEEVRVPVLRVDRPMADRAVEIGEKIGKSADAVRMTWNRAREKLSAAGHRGGPG